MKTSTRGRHGLQLLIDLAEHKEQKFTPLGSVSERQKVSVRYLEYVAIILKKSGFLASSKGISGGYKLNKDPSQIKIGDVLRVLEGDMNVIAPLKKEKKESRYGATVRKAVFNKINESIAALIDSLTLEKMLAK